MILVISGSSRRGSFNTRLARLIVDIRPDDTVTVLTDLQQLPFYDGDTETEGTPGAVADLRAAVTAAELVVVVTPEYNGTVPGLLGNAIDWLSRPARNSVLEGKPVLVLSASPTPHGGVRAADHLRTVLTRTGAHVHPDGLSVATAHQRLSEQPDPQLIADLADLLTRVLDQHPLPLTA